jgi:hypothetical protein
MARQIIGDLRPGSPEREFYEFMARNVEENIKDNLSSDEESAYA